MGAIAIDDDVGDALMATPATTYQREDLASVRAAGIERLLERYCHELTPFPDIPLKVLWPVYEAIEAQDRLRIYTGRLASELIGYACFTVAPHPHYGDSLQAHQAALYLAPEHRGNGTGVQLMAYADEQLAAEGCQVTAHHSKLAHPIDKALRALGYVQLETVWVKRHDTTSAAQPG
jgi:GNAT superfamily N-acetyltransferase